jgi:hypothetical protein
VLDRNDEQMPCIDRADVHESDARLVSIYNARWRSTGDNVAEHACFHIRSQRPVSFMLSAVSAVHRMRA